MGLKNKDIKIYAKKYEITEDQAKEILLSPFKFINTKSKNIQLTGLETEEEFNEKTYNYNIPYIGKLYCSYYKFLKIFKRNE